MKILIAPLNWGLGHATRCASLIRQYLNEGHEVVLAGDGDSLVWLKREFGELRSLTLAPLSLHYGQGKRQVFAMVCALPQLIRWAIMDHAMLRDIAAIEHFDLIISDNRFGFYLSKSTNDAHQSVNNNYSSTKTVYITHQINILLPRPWRWLEPIAAHWHKRIIKKYDELWIPDYEKGPGLAGILSHPSEKKLLGLNYKYIGPLSRFANTGELMTGVEHVNIAEKSGDLSYTVAVLSGLEPQRSLFEKELIARFHESGERLILVEGLVGKPNTKLEKGGITIYPWLTGEALLPILSHASRIIARSGYSTIMDLEALGLLSRAELHPTPGQPEQEYLSALINSRNAHQQ